MLLFHFITLTISGSDAGGTKTSGSQTSSVRDVLGEVHTFPRHKTTECNETLHILNYVTDMKIRKYRTEKR